ncbi:MAG: hypothetical protein SGJ02_05910 [bacterium]|nr:hypothetical protein [bacterium]
MFNDICGAICDLTECFDNHKLKYLIGGSVSSSLNGIFRTTNDVDVLVEKPLNQFPLLLKELSRKFIIDEEALVKHHLNKKAYNIFHEATALKIDLFPAHTEFHQMQLGRAISVKPPSASCAFKIATAEDIVLAKLVWLQKSSSDRQINDIIGVLNLNKSFLDLNYLRDWAEKLNVLESLEGLLNE